MLFNSIDFLIFLPIVFTAYWLAGGKNLKFQNLLLLISSYLFYSCWDWRFLFLLMFSTLLDFVTGLKISEAKEQKMKKFWFWVSISINVGFLGVFKYYNFFASSFAAALANIGLPVSPSTLNVILPVGISFYTFHGLSYVIDVYNKKINPERNFIDYSIFVSFFPLLVAGPIERATHLLPEIKRERVFNYGKAVDGLRQILWGLCKKIVLADQCAFHANHIFNNSEAYSGSTLALGAIFFSFQIYGDFSGYSDIALGTARLFGIELLKNFSYPYFSRNIAEFWRRWHMSLSSWFRDYLYIPLGGSNGGLGRRVRNTFIIFVVSGLWHGANWTFIVWGALHACYMMPLVLFHTNKKYTDIVAKEKVFPSLKETYLMCSTFCLVTLAFIFFRAQNLEHALNYIATIFSHSLLQKPEQLPKIVLLTITLFMMLEWFGRKHNYAIEYLPFKKGIRWSFYCILIIAITYYSGSEQPFIYFQF